MMLEATRDKLEEAKFFLRHLEDAQSQLQSYSQTPFPYYLSAFLGAAYSVEQYLDTEVIRMLRQPAGAKKLSGLPARPQYNKWLSQWVSALSLEQQTLWKWFHPKRGSKIHAERMKTVRGREIHVERTKTVTKEKAIRLAQFSGQSEQSWALGAYYLRPPMLAPFYPDITPDAAETIMMPELPLPRWATAWTYMQEHHIEIEGELHAAVKKYTEYVALLDDLISHFEQIVV